MKHLIDKKNTNSFTPTTTFEKQKLCTEKSLEDCVTKYGLRYVIKNFEIQPELFESIANGDFNQICDDEYTLYEIENFQKDLINDRLSTKK